MLFFFLNFIFSLTQGAFKVKIYRCYGLYSVALCKAKVNIFCRNKDYSDVPERMRTCWIKKNVRKCCKSCGSLVRAAVSMQSAVPYHLEHTSDLQLTVRFHAP